MTDAEAETETPALYLNFTRQRIEQVQHFVVVIYYLQSHLEKREIQ